MPFINRKLTQEESTIIVNKHIKRPGNGCYELDPLYWTINEEENKLLIYAQQNREFPKIHLFAFFWDANLIDRENMIGVETKYSYEYPCVIYTLKNIKIPNYLKDKEQEILKSLEEAIVVFGGRGKDPTRTKDFKDVKFAIDLGGKSLL